MSVVARGSGVSSGIADDLFRPFYTTMESGKGMGLSICRSIVTAHGGELWFTATDDRGSTFHFTLPTASEVTLEGH